MPLTHLQQLEAESIHIMREVVAEAEKPVMLYSIGKDSSVMLHLAMKAFYPAKPRFPLLHVDTTWKFREMYEFRDRMAKENGIDLLVHVNQEGLRMGINPFVHGSTVHTDIMKTQSLKQALDTHGFDLFAGSVDIFDVVGTPITLNLLITSLVCPESGHRAVLVSASPLARLEPMWVELIDLQLQFRCR